MAIDFSLLNGDPYKQSVSTMLQLMQMQNQKQIAGQEIASQEAQAMYQTDAQSAAANDRNSIEMMKAQQQQAQSDRQFGLDFMKAQDESQRDYYKTGVQQVENDRRFNFDLYKERFSEAKDMLAEQRAQEEFRWKAMDQASKQMLKAQISAAFQNGGGYADAAKIMAMNGFATEAADLQNKAIQQQNMVQDYQNKVLDGKKSWLEIQNTEKKQQAFDLGEAASRVVMDIASTQDPQLADVKMQNFLKNLAANGGPDLTGADPQVVMNTLVAMAQDHDTTVSNILKSPAQRAAFGQTIQNGMSNSNKYLGALAGIASAQEPTKTQQNFETYEKLLETDPAKAQAFKQFASQGTTIQMPGIDPKTGEPVFAPTYKTTSDIQETIRKDQEALRGLDRVKQNIHPELLTATGRLKTQIAKTSDWLGVASPSQAERLKAVEHFLTPVEQFFNQYRKDITGAAASMQEIQRLREATINSNLGPNQFKQRLDSIIQGFEVNANAEIKNLSSGLSPDRTKATLDDSQKSSDDHRNALLGIINGTK